MTDKTLPEVGSSETRACVFEVDEATRSDLAETRSIEISMSSETPVNRWFGSEILEHGKDGVDLKFMNSGAAPLLLDHDRRRQIGVVTNVRLDGKKMRGTVRFGKSALAQEILDDIADGIRSNVSIGYRIQETVVNEKKDTVRVTKWSPYEASIVAIPADTSVGVGRAASIEQEAEMSKNENQPVASPATVQTTGERDLPGMQEMQTPIEPQSTATVATPEGQREVQFMGEAEQQKWLKDAQEHRNLEASEIMSLGSLHNMTDKAREFVRDGKSLAQFTGHVRENIPDDKPIRNTNIGMTREETQRFSIMNLSRAYHPNAGQAVRDAASFEIEAVRTAMEEDKSGVEAKGIRMPMDVLNDWVVPGSTMHRDLAIGTRTLSVLNDGDLVPQDYRPGSFIDVLRNIASALPRATLLQGLSGDVDIPKKLTASAPAWLAAEGSDAGPSEPTFGLVSLRPKDLAVYTDMTRRMRQQASPDIENLVRMDIVAGMALGLDLAALEGSGAAGQPLGVLNTVGIGAPASFAGVNPNWAEVVALESAVADQNALMGNLAYIGRTNMRGALKTTSKDAGSGQFIMNEGNELNGYPYVPSNQGTDGNLYYGNWSDLLVGMWGTLDLRMDYSALHLSDGLRMLAFQTVDVAVRHAQSFAYNNDGV